MEEANKDPFVQLREKMVKAIQDSQPYEALQLAESYVARKKKSLGRNVTSALVFHACGVLMENGASSNAGSLLSWFIEDGAGDDYYFKLEERELIGDLYCDAKRLQELLGTVTAEVAFPLVEKIYGPIHKLILKKPIDKRGALWQRLQDLELNWINIFEETRNWNSAYRAIVRIGDMDRASRILHSWSQDGFRSEQPLFFARAVLQLLADGHVTKSADLITFSSAYISESDILPGDPRAAALGIWHFALILSNLAAMEPRPRVDKVKVFGILTERYYQLIARVDPKLVSLFEKIGQNSFGVKSAASEQPNPMAALFQNMLSPQPQPAAAKKKKAIAPAGGGLPEGFDLNAMMSMMSKLQGSK